MTRRIGLLGGSFNPAHAGHLHVAATALKRLRLTEVWFVLALGNPLKVEHGDYDERAASVGAQIAPYARFKLCEIEAEQGLSYTIDTIATLKHIYRDDAFVWLMGGDNLETFHRWRAWEQIACAVPMAIIARPGARPFQSVFERRFAFARLEERAAPTLADYKAPAWVYLRAPLHPQSSTHIRNGVRQSN